MLWLDGVYQEDIEQPQCKPRLHRARAPTSAQLTQLADTIAHRVCRHLARHGWLEGEDESAFLSHRAGCDDGLDALRMSSITYRIATGTQAGRKVATLQTIPADNGSLEGDACKVGGFSLHAGVAVEAHEGQKLERLCQYIARPAISEKRLSISPQGTALPAQDAVEERHDARGLRAGGVHRQTRGAGGATACAPDPVSRRLCPERQLARAAHGIRAWQTSCYGRGVDWGQKRPPQSRRKAPIDDLGATPQARVWHRLERLRPLWRDATDRGQHRTTHRHPRHTRKGSSMPRPLRKARRAGESALPTRPARSARSCRVTARRPRCRRRNEARPHEAATIPQGSARPAVGNRREIAANGAAEHPSTRPNPLR